MTERVSQGHDDSAGFGINSDVWKQVKDIRRQKPRSRTQHRKNLIGNGSDSSSEPTGRPTDQPMASDNVTGAYEAQISVSVFDPVVDFPIDEDRIMDEVTFVCATPNVDKLLEFPVFEGVSPRNPHFSRIDRNGLRLNAARNIRGLEELTARNFRVLMQQENLAIFIAPLSQF